MSDLPNPAEPEHSFTFHNPPRLAFRSNPFLALSRLCSPSQTCHTQTVRTPPQLDFHSVPVSPRLSQRRQS